jgi:peptidoglycan/xylan/chitin deacetylase (PgdA/CDA1 family)
MIATRLWPLALALMVGTLSACNEEPTPPQPVPDDAGIRRDAGVTDDAGVGTDAGVDPCSVANACSPNATCEAVGGAARCTCKAGYTGDGATCADIDECGTGTDTCDANATCTNTPGGFTCGACNSGYVADSSGACVDVNECGTDTDNCDANATCTNTPGSFTCACNSGYRGNGTTCRNEASFAEGMITITLDDGWDTQFTGARPGLNQRGIRSTYYIPSEPIRDNWANYMRASEIQTLLDEGNELASHSKTHPNLTTVPVEQMELELRESQEYLKTRFGVSVPAFAVPFGKYNDAVIATAKQYYGSHRTVAHGNNSPGTNIYKLRAYDVESGVAVSTVRGWINKAKLDKTWIILLFHEFVSGTPTRTTQINIANFEAILDDVKASGLRIVTMAEGLAMMDGVTTDPTGYTVVHEDEIGLGFLDWSWGTYNLQERGVVRKGVTSISFEPDNWNGLTFHHDGAALDANLYQSINLWVHGGTTGGQRISVNFYDGAPGSPVLIGSAQLDTVLGRPIQAGVWQQVTIPFSAMKLSTGSIREIRILDASGMDQGTTYLDEILLIRR